MRDVFNGWRRKVGCTALVMACALMVGWMRSYYYVDVITLNSGRRTSDQFQSASGYLVCWSRRTVVGDFADYPLLQGLWGQKNDGTSFGTDVTGISNMNWSIRSSGLGVCQVAPEGNPDGQCRLCFVAYSYVVVPLTLLSAFLLVWKPRQRTGPDYA